MFQTAAGPVCSVDLLVCSAAGGESGSHCYYLWGEGVRGEYQQSSPSPPRTVAGRHLTSPPLHRAGAVETGNAPVRSDCFVISKSASLVLVFWAIVTDPVLLSIQLLSDRHSLPGRSSR